MTVVGTAGVGKTRLALEIADGLAAPGGVWLVRLDAVDSSVALEQVVAETLQVTGGAVALHERLSGAETILVLDNCEHVVETAGALATSLLETAPTLRVLATSQTPLGVDGEHVHPLEPLSQEHSVALFAERAKRMRRQFALDAATTALVDDVCRALDGLPLAIELAAARVRSLSMRDIVRHLDDRFALLSDPSSHRPERRRGLEAAISWSYDLLFPDDQRVLWALCCFAGSAPLDATEHVAASLGVPPAAVPDTVTRLLDRSLLAVDVAVDGSVRYRLLDSIRTFAADRLREAGLTARAAAAHASWYARAAAWCDAHVRGADQPSSLAVARAERENIDLALAWCAAHDPDLGVEIATGFGWAWVVVGDGADGAARVRNTSTRSTPARARLSSLLLAGWLEASAGNLTLAETDLDAARAIALDLGDAEAVADVQRHVAFLRIQQGRPDDVLSCAAASLTTYRELGLPWQTATSLVLTAFGALLLGDTIAATRDGTTAIELLTGLGDSWGLVHAEAMLAGIAQAEHRFDDAERSLTRAADESRALGFTGQTALHLATLVRVQQRGGRFHDAASSFLEAIAAAAAVGDGRLACTARLNLARLRRVEGDHQEATVLLEQNVRWYDAAGGGDGALLTRCLLYAEKGDRQSLEDVLAQAVDAENDEVRVLALDALARSAASRGDVAQARELLDQADALLPKAARNLDEADRIDRVQALEALSA